MVARKHPKVIEGRRWLTAMGVIDPEEAYNDGVVDVNGASLDEEYDSCSGEAGVSTGVSEVESE